MSEEDQSPLVRFLVLPILSGFVGLYVISKLLPENLEQNHPFWHIVMSEPLTEILLSTSIALATPILSLLFLTRRGLLFLLSSVIIGGLLGYFFFLMIGGRIVPHFIYGVVGGMILSGYMVFLISSYKAIKRRLPDEKLNELRDRYFNIYTGSHLLVGESDNSGCLSELGVIMTILAGAIYIGTLFHAHFKFSMFVSVICATITLLLAGIIEAKITNPVRPKERITCKGACCSCMISEDEGTCSILCESGGGLIQLSCDCGHIECDGNYT